MSISWTVGQTPLSYAVRKQYLPVAQTPVGGPCRSQRGPFRPAPRRGRLLRRSARTETAAGQRRRSEYQHHRKLGGPQRGVALWLPASQPLRSLRCSLLSTRNKPTPSESCSTPKPTPIPPIRKGTRCLFEALPHAPTLKALLEGGADPNRWTPRASRLSCKRSSPRTNSRSNCCWPIRPIPMRAGVKKPDIRRCTRRQKAEPSPSPNCSLRAGAARECQGQGRRDAAP